MAVDTRRVTRNRVPRGPRKRTVWYVEEADRAEHRGRGHNSRRSRLGVRNTGWNDSPAIQANDGAWVRRSRSRVH